jgi:hypothetical protein
MLSNVALALEGRDVRPRTIERRRVVNLPANDADVFASLPADIMWVSPGQIAAWLMNGTTLSQSKYINQSGSTWLISDTP